MFYFQIIFTWKRKMNYMNRNVGMRPGVQPQHVREAHVVEGNKGEQMNSLPKFEDFLKTALQVSSLFSHSSQREDVTSN